MTEGMLGAPGSWVGGGFLSFQCGLRLALSSSLWGVGVTKRMGALPPVLGGDFCWAGVIVTWVSSHSAPRPGLSQALLMGHGMALFPADPRPAP